MVLKSMRLDLINLKTDGDNHKLIPFLFNLTEELKVKSHFKKSGNDIFVSVEGHPNLVKTYVDRVEGVSTFTETDKIPQFSGPCPECLKEAFDPESRRYLYHLTACNNCGPGFSLFKKLPFSRTHSSLNDYLPCSECEKEAQFPGRRHKFSLISCPLCGPKLKLLDEEGLDIPSKSIISKIAYLLNKNQILAIKTFAGFRLFAKVNRRNAHAVRQIINCSDMPVELFFDCIKSIAELFQVSLSERYLLSKGSVVNLKLKSYYRKHMDYLGNLARCKVAPTMLHALTLKESQQKFLIDIGAHRQNEPPILEDNLVVKSLNEKVDYFAVDGLGLENPETTETFTARKDIKIIVKSHFREFNLPSKQSVIALGDEKSSSLAIATGSKTYVLPLNCDLDNFQSLKRYRESYKWLTTIAQVQPLACIATKNPNSKLKNFSKKLGCRSLGAQHHHSHATSVMAEHGLDEDVFAVILDSGGYLSEGEQAGGEFLIANRKSYKKVAFFEPILLPGPEACARQPWRVALSLLYQTFGEDFFPYPQLFHDISQQEISLVKTMLQQRINCLSSNSMTLILNGLASITGISHKLTYTSLIKENLSTFESKIKSSYLNRVEDFPEIKLSKLISDVYYETFVTSAEEINCSIRLSLALIIKEALRRLRKKYKLNKVVLSGDFFEEILFFETLRDFLIESGFSCYTNEKLPLNDTNISLGQIAIAAKHHGRPFVA